MSADGGDDSESAAVGAAVLVVVAAPRPSGSVGGVLVDLSLAEVVAEEVVAVPSVDVVVASSCAKAGLTMRTAAASTVTRTLTPANAITLLFMNINIVAYRRKRRLTFLWILSTACGIIWRGWHTPFRHTCIHLMRPKVQERAYMCSVAF
jgi:hypothetical protein